MLMAWMEAEASRRSEEPSFLGWLYVEWEPCFFFWLGGASKTDTLCCAVLQLFLLVWFGRPIAASWMLSVHPRPLKTIHVSRPIGRRIPVSYLN
jgi:hypothetical protein